MPGGETTNIMEMAIRASDSILSRFGWRLTGPTNENFSCIQIDKHQKSENPSHPVDAVFEYDDPYTSKRNYLLTDYKSYSYGSIIASRVRSALINISKAVDCANISSEWQERYVNSELSWSVHGMLFIYNHDGQYDKDFHNCLIETKYTRLDLPRHSKLFVMGPDKIEYLMNIINDIDGERGRNVLPPDTHINFWYPDLVTRRPTSKLNSMARIELLLGPWQILPYEKVVSGHVIKGIYLYYAGLGNSPKEFEFLMDFCFKNQLVQPNCTINIRSPNGVDVAQQNFEQAQDNIFRCFHSFPEIRNRLDQFQFNRIDIVRTRFSTIQIGMDARNG